MRLKKTFSLLPAAALLSAALWLSGCTSLPAQREAGNTSAAATAPADQSAPVHLMTSGGFTAAYKVLYPQFEKESGWKMASAYGSSMGASPESIPNRLARQEPADVVVLARPALDELVAKGLVKPGSQVDLVRSAIGVAVKKGSPVPAIGTLEELKQTLLNAKTIAYSASASGTYYETQMLKKMGIEAQVLPKSRKIVGERVGAVVARGEAELGLQQVSELLPIEGIEYIGTLPEAVQHYTIFSAGIASQSTNPAGAQAAIRYFTSPQARPAIIETGLEPVPQR